MSFKKQPYRCSISYQRQMVLPVGKITTAKDAADILRANVDWDTANGQEVFVALFLNRNNGVLAFHTLHIGGQSSTIVDPKTVFTAALLHNAAAMVICHNHPSGNTTPSNEDRRITKKLVKAATYLDLQVLDHIILTDTDYYSFAENDILDME